MMIPENKIIYFDNAATTKVDDEVVSTFLKSIKEYYANPSSIHVEGAKAARALYLAREKILKLLKLFNHELIFTSGATESNNLAIKGACLKYANRGKHIIVSMIEHPSVLEVAEQLKNEFGFEVSYAKSNEKGVVTLDEIKSLMRKDTILVSVMSVNNETGVINPIEDIAKFLKDYPKTLFHVDACQSIGKVDLNYNDVDLLTFTGHKIHGLKSIGALVKKKGLDLLPLNSGGGQENNLRSGTNDLALSLSLAKALDISLKEMKSANEQISEIKAKIEEYLKENPSLYRLNSNENSIPHILNFSLLTKKAAVVVESLSNNAIMVSSTSACHAHKEPDSYVVYDMTHDEKLSHNTIRLSFDKNNTIEEAEIFIKTLDKIIKEVK